RGMEPVRRGPPAGRRDARSGRVRLRARLARAGARREVPAPPGRRERAARRAALRDGGEVMTRRSLRIFLLWLGVVVGGGHLAWASDALARADEVVALARPGGGSSFKGGSRSGSSSR